MSGAILRVFRAPVLVFRRPGVVVTGLLALLLAGCGSGPRLDSWCVDSLVKVFPDDSKGTHELAGGPWLIPRNGHTTIQIALRSKAGVSGLSVVAKGPQLGSRQLPIQIRRAGYVPVGSNPPGTPPDEVIREAPALYPDPLLEEFPFDLPAGETHAVLLTVYCPAGTSPGEYEGKVEFRGGDRRIDTMRYTVRVVNATVPEKQSLKVTNWFNLREAHLRAHYPALTRNPEAYWEILENVGRVMAEHRQNTMLTPVTSLVDASVSGGAIRYSFARLDRWISTFEKAGLIGTIEGGHLLGRKSGFQTQMVIPAYIIEGGKPVWKNLEPDDPRGEQFFNSFLPALMAFLKEKGWQDRYIQHIHDEPHGVEAPIYNRYGKIIRRNLPGIPTIDAVGFDQDIGFFAEVSDIWVPVLSSFDQRLDLLRDHLKKGGQCWFYTCIGPQGRYLNRFIDYPLLKVRLLHWFNFRHELSGFLHWGGNYWGPKPFQNVQTVINDNHTLLPAGDNAIVYPAPEKNSVLSSIRLEEMREGIEDYELLLALSKKDPQKAGALSAAAIPHISDYVRDTEQFRRLRRQLLEAF